MEYSSSPSQPALTVIHNCIRRILLNQVQFRLPLSFSKKKVPKAFASLVLVKKKILRSLKNKSFFRHDQLTSSLISMKAYASVWQYNYMKRPKIGSRLLSTHQTLGYEPFTSKVQDI